MRIKNFPQVCSQGKNAPPAEHARHNNPSNKFCTFSSSIKWAVRRKHKKSSQQNRCNAGRPNEQYHKARQDDTTHRHSFIAFVSDLAACCPMARSSVVLPAFGVALGTAIGLGLTFHAEPFLLFRLCRGDINSGC